MDLINQNKFRNWLLIILLVLNILTISIIWMNTTEKTEPQQKGQDSRTSESINLMKKELDLSESQTKQLEIIRTNKLEQLKYYNDQLDLQKKRLAEELFNQKADTILANSIAYEIGLLQAKVEILRFQHFNELLAICTPEQKEKLKPILVELFSRKPPKSGDKNYKPSNDFKKERNPKENKKEYKISEIIKDAGQKEEEFKPAPKSQPNDKPPKRQDDRPRPPSVDEKLTKYSERLNLSAEQEQKVRIMLQTSMQKGEQLRNKSNPDPSEVEIEKEKIRKEEDENIFKILNAEQKKKFEEMISKRRK